jgi:hypothetical protein
VQYQQELLAGLEFIVGLVVRLAVLVLHSQCLIKQMHHLTRLAL